MAKIKHNTDGKILHNTNHKIVDECGAIECGCDPETLGTIYRVTVAANTFTGDCAGFFNGNTFDIDHEGTFSTDCCKSLDIEGLGCDQEAFGAAVTACFSANGVVVSFSVALGETVNFFFENELGGNFNCTSSRTVPWLENAGVSGGLLSEAGKTVGIERIL